MTCLHNNSFAVVCRYTKWVNNTIGVANADADAREQMFPMLNTVQ